MNMVRFAYLIIVFLPGTGIASAGAPTVLELFTSQGCSTCPPADALLRTMRDKPDILVLSWPVDYWNRLGWQDTFAHPRNAKRQAAYNKRLGRGGVFTPQIVIDGLYQCVGSNMNDVRSDIDKATASRNRSIEPILAMDGDQIILTLPSTNIPDEVSVRIVWYTKDANVRIRSGENQGRLLHYANIVRHSYVSNHWTGEAKSIAMAITEAADYDADGIAILLHKGHDHGPIIGAVSLDLEGNL